MSFMPTPVKDHTEVGFGPKSAKIMIVGDVPDAIGLKDKKPFGAASMGVLESCLHQARLTKAEVYMMNLVYDDSRIGKYWKEKKPKRILTDLSGYQQVLDTHIAMVRPKVIAAMGELTCHLLTGKSSLVQVRGYPFKSEKYDCVIVPVLPVRDMIWSNYIWRYYLSHDLSKIARYAREGYQRLETRILYTLSYAELCSVLDLVHDSIKRTFCDIEVSNFEVSCISFTLDDKSAVVVPFDSRWTDIEETVLWGKVARILENYEIKKGGQNFIFDSYFLAYKMGIYTQGLTEDTMMAHSIMYPDFLKGLGFLGSIYTDFPYWKDMVNFKDYIKKEA